MRQLKRDPFARLTHVSMQLFYDSPTGCSWCGYTPKTKTGRHYLYTYGVQHDDHYGTTWERKSFCNRACQRAYWGR